ncbi:MAG: membrane protein insertase YidC [Pseudomonadota bacterium]
MDDQNKNLLLATGLSFLVILVWFLLFPPEAPQDLPAPQAQTTAPTEDGIVTPAPSAEAPIGAVGGLQPNRDQALEASPRIELDSDQLTGSISLAGGRIDDLQLKGYRTTLEEDAPIVTLLSPAGASGAYYALHGWAPAGDLSPELLPGATTKWTTPAGAKLTPQTPLVLTWDNGAGLVFQKTIEIDDRFMFTVTQTVRNNTAEAIRLFPYGLLARRGKPQDLRNFFVLHEGMIAATDGALTEKSYSNLEDLDIVAAEGAHAEVLPAEQNGWIGFTDHYWMATLAPQAGQAFTAVAKYTPSIDTYQTDMRLPVVEVGPGTTAQSSTRLFAGAKEWADLRAYERDLGIEQFVDAIDWGWFYYFTKPIFQALHYLNLWIGNMGWAIIALTVVIKTLLLPLAYKSYVSMSKMKKLQPEMEKIKERVGDDRTKLQTEMMELYKKEKVNPASGCLPILVQIPIFFSLYKVIFVTIELRHAPFFGWIKDLSAPDPSSFLNLFGLLPFTPPDPTSLLGIFSIGVFPILMGVTMWMQQKLNPAPTDPTQAMIFNWLPWIFMFMLGTFAAGLVIYWCANNILTFSQQ